jgi:hypothetical protein
MLRRQATELEPMARSNSAKANCSTASTTPESGRTPHNDPRPTVPRRCSRFQASEFANIEFQLLHPLMWQSISCVLARFLCCIRDRTLPSSLGNASQSLGLSSGRRLLVRKHLCAANQSSGGSLARDQGWQPCPYCCANRLGEDARSLSRRDRRPGTAGGQGIAQGRDTDRLCVPSQSSLQRYSAQSGGSACRHQGCLASARITRRRHSHLCAHRRYAPE